MISKCTVCSNIWKLNWMKKLKAIAYQHNSFITNVKGSQIFFGGFGPSSHAFYRTYLTFFVASAYVAA